MWMGNAGRLTQHGWCLCCMHIYWSVIYVIFSAQGRYRTPFTLCGKSFNSPWNMVCFLPCVWFLFALFLHSHPRWPAHMTSFSRASLYLCHMHRYLLSQSSSVSPLWCFIASPSVCSATGIFADVSCPAATERDAVEAEGDKREETIVLRLTLPPTPQPRPEVGIWMVESVHLNPCMVHFLNWAQNLCLVAGTN